MFISGKEKYIKLLNKKNKTEYLNCLNCKFNVKSFENYMSIDGNNIEYLESFCRYLRKKVGIKIEKIENNHCLCFRRE